jgi:hypothetical protein
MSERLRPIVCLALAFAALGVAACAPEVGSEAWCRRMDDTPKGDWTANEAADYARSCLFGSN